MAPRPPASGEALQASCGRAPADQLPPYQPVRQLARAAAHLNRVSDKPLIARPVEVW